MSGHFYGCRSFARHFDDLMDDTYFEINGQMISYLPKFRGAHVDNPLIHLRDLHIACNTLRPRGVNEADFMLRMFVYSLTGYAKSWLLSLSVSSMPQWEKMRQLFLMEYSIKQHPRETTYEYLERFRDMWDTCPDYSLPDHVVALNFLDGMNSHEREMMDVMAGGEIMECYPEDVWDLIYQRATCTNPNAEPTHYNNAPTRSLEDIVQQLAQTMRQNQEKNDEVYAEISKQIAQNSEVIFGRQGITEKPRSDVDADALWNGRDLDVEQTKTTRYFKVEQTDFIMGEEHVIVANKEEEGTPNPSLSAPVTSSLPTPIVNPVLNKLPLETQHSPDSHSKVSNVIVNENNMSNALLLFSMRRDSPTEKEDPIGNELQRKESMQHTTEMCVQPYELQSLGSSAIHEILSEQQEEEATPHVQIENEVIIPSSDLVFVEEKEYVPSCGVEEAIGEDKVMELTEGVNVGMSSAIACKKISKCKRTFHREHKNWKRRKKKKCTIRDDKVSLFLKRKRRRHSMFEWKPGWNFWRSASGTQNKRVRTSYRKFDGVHPWAPNL